MPGADVEKRPSYPPVPVQVKKPDSGSLVPAFRWLRKNRHLTVPLAVPPATWTAAEIMHALGLGDDVAIAGGVLTITVWFFAPHKWTNADGSPRMTEVWYARASVGVLAAWLWAASRYGAASGLAGMVLGVLLFAGSVAWGIPWWQHKRPRGMRKRQRMIARWETWWQAHAAAWGLAGSRVIDAREAHVTIRLRVQLFAGRQSVLQVRQSVHLIESGLEGIADIGRVRVEAVKGNPSQVDLFFKRDNPLREVVEWDPALAPRSVHDQAADGLSETGEWVHTPMRVNAFVGGRTRSGKSNHLKLRIAQLTGCPDDRQVVIDLKGGRSGRPMIEAGAVDYVITEVDEARLYLLMLTREIAARAKHCYTGEEQLEATPEVPAIHTLIDETRSLTSINAGDSQCANLLATIASTGSGLEIYAEVYTQYGSLEESVATEQTRSNLKLRAVYAVEEARHGAFFIPEYDKFDASKLEEQGTHLLKQGPKAHAEQIRAVKMQDELLKRITAANARRLAPRPAWVLYCGGEPCPGGGTWQEWWDRRWLRLDPAFRKLSPQYREALERFAGQAGAFAADAGVMVDRAPSVPIAAAPSAPGEGDGVSVAARIGAETDGPDIPPPDRRTSARHGQVMRERKDAFADALAAAARGITPAQLESESGMSSSWIYPMLGSLTEAHAVTRLQRGLYAPAPGADIHEAIRRVEGTAAGLAKEAQRTVRQLQPAS